MPGRDHDERSASGESHPSAPSRAAVKELDGQATRKSGLSKIRDPTVASLTGPANPIEELVAKIVSIHSFRGGSGKTNIVANLAATLTMAGNRVAVVDADLRDPGIHLRFGLSPEQTPCTLNCFLWGECSIDKAAYNVTAPISERYGVEFHCGEIFVIPASIRPSHVARVSRDAYDASLLNDGFFDLIAELGLDYLLVDTHPGADEATLRSIAVADVLYLAMRPGEQEFQGTGRLLELVKQYEVPRIEILLSKVPRDLERSALREQVENACRKDVAAAFPLCVEMAEPASAALFVLRYPEHAFSREIEHLSRLVARPEVTRHELAV